MRFRIPRSGKSRIESSEGRLQLYIVSVRHCGDDIELFLLSGMIFAAPDVCETYYARRSDAEDCATVNLIRKELRDLAEFSESPKWF